MKKIVQNKKKFLVFLFVYFLFVTSYFSIMTLSKFVGIVNGTGTVAIAKWEVFADTSDNNTNILNAIIGNDDKNPSYILNITSTSEIKAIYSIVLSDLPNNVQVKLDDGDYMETIDNTISFNDIGYINADADISNRTIRHTLTFNVPIDTDTINESQINIDVIFNQVNPDSLS